MPGTAPAVLVRMAANLNKFPNLLRLVKAGLVQWNENAREWVGIASDSVTVSIGHDCKTAERYLAARPTPNLW